MNPEVRTCQNCKESFALTEEDLAMYGSAGIPPTDKCVDCSLAFLAAFWLIGRFRIAKSAFSGKQIITILPQTVQFPIYAHDEFVSDNWDPLAYGQEYDSRRSFFDQLVELQAKVPHPHRTGIKNVDCEWTDDWWESKNCYLSRSGYRVENLSYSYRIGFSRDGLDLTYGFNIEQSYDSTFNYRGWKLKYCFNTHDCTESSFLYDCRSCNNCFMSWNLRNKSYCIMNQQYTKEEYFKKLSEYNLGSYAVVEKLREEFWKGVASDAVHRANLNTQVVACRGNFMDQNKNCVDCAFVEQSDNCRRIIRGFETKDAIEAVSPGITEKTARSLLDQFSYGNSCVMYTTNCRYSMYLDACEDCEYCFGCVGLRKKKYCILNKQYTEVEYKRLLSEIKASMEKSGEWGQFMPFQMAYGGYNISLAQMMYPRTKEDALKMGVKWDESLAPVYTDAISSSDLPDDIRDAQDSFTKQRVLCSETKLSYNIAPHELSFYKAHIIPLPRKHFDLRFYERFKTLSLMFRPQKGSCHYCKKEIEHFYDPQLRYQKITCVECYQQNIA